LSRSRKKRPSRGIFRRVLRFCLPVLLILVLLTAAEVAILKVVNPPITAFTAWTWVHSQVVSKPYRRPRIQWRPLVDISPHLIKAVLAGEDQRFLSHHGFDFIELNEAVRDILMSGRMRGASTITMQVARTVFLWPERSWLRKAAEAYYTLLIEILWSKKRVLEVYLNTVDWGTGIMGAEAASRKYFQTGSDRITPVQAAGLAAMLPCPHVWSPGSPDRQFRERRKRILKDMRKMPSFRDSGD
jgi:monofunctional biosynthetic peptidoglycan transglycosylase